MESGFVVDYSHTLPDSDYESEDGSKSYVRIHEWVCVRKMVQKKAGRRL
jgi:hypothetical protein